MIELTRALEARNRLSEFRDPELLLLKGHLILERVLVAVVAARLQADDGVLARVRFGALTDLAFSADAERIQLVRINDLRNALAHEFDALDSERFRSGVRSLGAPWPDGSLERAIVLESLLQRAIDRSLLEMVRYMQRQEPEDPGDDEGNFERWEKLQALESQMKSLVEQRQAIHDDIRSEEWDRLVRAFRPGWRPT